MIFYASLLLLLNPFQLQADWVDPHAMNSQDSKTILSIRENEPEQTYHCPTSINFSLAHYKRVINWLLGAVVLDRSDTSNYKGRINVKIPLASYDLLRDFSRSSVDDPAVLRNIDNILSRILIKPTYEHVAEALETWTDHVYFTFYNRSTGILCACLFIVFISYKLLRANLTIWSVAKYLIFLGWITDFAFTWVSLLQEAEINKMADSLRYENVPAYCDPNKMSIWQYMWYSISSESDCRKYHHVVYKDVFWSTAPLTVFSHQLGIMILTPASNIGKAIGSFTSGILATLPWGVNIILLPFLLIFSAIIFCITFSFLTQTSFSFNFFHVFQLKFGNDERRFIGDMITGSNLNKLVDVAHSMIDTNRDIRKVVQLVQSEQHSSQHRHMIEELDVNKTTYNRNWKSRLTENVEKDVSGNAAEIPLECESCLVETNKDTIISEAQGSAESKKVVDSIETMVEACHDGSGDSVL